MWTRSVLGNRTFPFKVPAAEVAESGGALSGLRVMITM
jgi:hypothetical protein